MAGAHKSPNVHAEFVIKQLPEGVASFSAFVGGSFQVYGAVLTQC